MGKTAFKMLARTCGWLALVPYVGIVLLVMSGSPTWSAVAYLAGMGLLLSGLMSLPISEKRERRMFGRKAPRGVTRAGLIAIGCVGFVRCCSGGQGESLAFSPSARFVDRLVDERDIALSGTRVLAASGMHLLHDDAEELPIAMRDAYKQMATEQGDVPSPVFATYMGLQGPNEFDLITIEPQHFNAPPTDAVLFLHGYAGNFTLPCWQVSDAVKELNVLTVCPSTRWIGDWGSANGEATVRKTVKVLHERGITKIVLVGLSNGGFYGSILAAKMRGSFVGTVFISGVTARAASTGCPTLLIHGRKDSMAGFGESTEYVANHPGTKLVALDAGHFAMLVRSKETNAALRSFVLSVTHQTAATTSMNSAHRSL